MTAPEKTTTLCCSVCGGGALMDRVFEHGDGFIAFSMSGRIGVHNVQDPKRVVKMLGRLIGYHGKSMEHSTRDIGARCRSEVWEWVSQPVRWTGGDWTRASESVLRLLRGSAGHE